ncbi:MAG: hypothetical protein WD767_20150 [Alphaproteobacteria bacterium]
MAKLDMDGPFELSNRVIDTKVSANLIGNYALGYMNSNGKFVVKVVGRADSDLRRELKAARKKYRGGFLSRIFGGETLDRFKFSYADSVDAAYQAECRAFEAFGGTAKLRNNVKPVPPTA